MPFGKKLPVYGIALALLVLILDQLTKAWVLDIMQPPQTIVVTSFFNLVLTWNRGVSFGLLYHQHDYMPYVLSAVAFIICAWLGRWLLRVENLMVALALGLVLGGAIGNVVDRLRFGAVVDFLDFHVANWHWPSFNLADTCIVVGVGLLLLDGWLEHRRERLAHAKKTS